MVVMKELKNIITINDFNYSQGGASKVAIDTANMLAERGYNSVFISAVSDRDKSSLNENVVQYEFGGKEFLHYDNKITGMLDGLKCRNFTRYIENLLDNYSSENTVVHIHGWTKACSSDFFRVLKKRGFKTFLTLHEYFSFCPNGAYFDYKKNTACNKKGCSLSCLLCNCDSRNYLFKLYRFLRELKYTRDIDFSYVHPVFISKFEKKIVDNQYYVNKYSFVENPINPLNVATKEKKFDFAFIGRTSKEKGIDLFIELAKRKPDCKFLIVGEYHSFLPNLTITGWISESEVDRYISLSRAIIFPSLWPETFGLNVVRSINAGIPCFVSSNTAAEDYVVDGINGYVFKQGDFNDLLNKINMCNYDDLISVTKIQENYIVNLIKQFYG